MASLSKTEQQNLIDDLEHGAALLTNTRQLNAYIVRYGEIHQAKLLHAYEKIPSKVWHEDGITVVDYGCGQGIAEMVLSDYMASRYIDNDYIKDYRQANSLLYENSYSLYPSVKRRHVKSGKILINNGRRPWLELSRQKILAIFTKFQLLHYENNIANTIAELADGSHVPDTDRLDVNTDRYDRLDRSCACRSCQY